MSNTRETIAALIPLRGGSKSVPRKNIRPIAGRRLYEWCTEAALDSGVFDSVWVSTEDDEIKKLVRERFGGRVGIIDRPVELAEDVTSSEAVMAHFLAQVPCDMVSLVQATSPLTAAEDFRRAIDTLKVGSFDSLVTVVESKRFFWSPEGQALNYDPHKRPRRQDFSGALMENGAFYLTKRKAFEVEGCRLGGRVAVYRMAEETAFEIDEPADWDILEQLLLRKKVLPSLNACQVRAIVCDVDGTLTDGAMYYGEGGEVLKRFDTRDGEGLARVRAAGLRVGVITKENSPSVHTRMAKLGIEDYIPGCQDKATALKELSKRWNIPLSSFAYVGDDESDRDPLHMCGYTFCPVDAPAIGKLLARYICTQGGGRGAVREVCELILKARD